MAAEDIDLIYRLLMKVSVFAEPDATFTTSAGRSAHASHTWISTGAFCAWLRCGDRFLGRVLGAG